MEAQNGIPKNDGGNVVRFDDTLKKPPNQEETYFKRELDFLIYKYAKTFALKFHSEMDETSNCREMTPFITGLTWKGFARSVSLRDMVGSG